MTLADKLEALLAAAKAGPYFFAYNRIVSQPLSREYDRIERTFPDDIADDDPRWNELPNPDVAHVDTSHGDTASRQGAADADLIVAAVNALPALLRVVRAAEAWRERKTDDGEELRAALDALDKEAT